MNKRIRNKRGFSLAEVLTVTAIVVILFGVAFAAVINHLRSMNQLEKDGIAKEIFVAAQNHLSAAESQGYLGFLSADDAARSSFGTEELGEDGKGTGIFYYIVNAAGATDSNGTSVSASPNDQTSFLSRILPFASVDDTVRLGGSYIIRYQRDPALVLDVFYSNVSGRFHHSFSDSEYSTLVPDYCSDEMKAARRRYGTDNSVIGWYGGEPGQRITVDDSLQAPTVTYRNAERLQFFVKDPNTANADARLRLVIEGLSSEKLKYFDLSTSLDADLLKFISYDTATATYTVNLDDVTKPGCHFYDLLGADGFIPGENIKVYAQAYSSTALSDLAGTRSGEVVTNSIYGDATTTAQAEIANVRHLENLDYKVSMADANDTASNLVDITAAVQTADLSWPSFKSAVGGEPVICATEYNGGEALTDAGNFYPVTPKDTTYVLHSYDGGGHSISGVTILANENNAGLFAEMRGTTGEHYVIRDLELIDFDVECRNGHSAGALAGSLEYVDVSGVLVRNSDAAAALEITGATGSAGGLIGSLSNGTVTECAAAVYVRSGGNAGGLIGTATGSSVTGSYSGGHTRNGVYLTGTGEGEIARVNVISTAGSAGGLIGSADGTSLSYTYSTSSAAGSTAGGLVGTAGNGSIANSYTVGLVVGTGSEPRTGAFAGSVSGTALSGANRYYEIVNEGLTTVGDGSFTDGASVTELDANLKTYNEFIMAKNVEDGRTNAAEAVPYDTGLLSEFKSYWDMRTVYQLTGGQGTAALTRTHYGDWPSPETKIINAKVLNSGSAGAAQLPAGVGSVSVIYAPDDGLPEGVGLTVNAVTENRDTYLNSAAALMDLSDGFHIDAELLDISLVADGDEVQPDGAVSVALRLNGAVRAEELQVIHFGAEPERVSAVLSGDTLVFRAESFSVYAVVRTPLKAVVETEQGEVYHVTLSCGPETELPENARLSVRVLTNEDEDYIDYMKGSVRTLDEDAEDVQFIRAFDVRIVDPATGEEFPVTEDMTLSFRLLETPEEREARQAMAARNAAVAAESAETDPAAETAAPETAETEHPAEAAEATEHTEPETETETAETETAETESSEAEAAEPETETTVSEIAETGDSPVGPVRPVIPSETAAAEARTLDKELFEKTEFSVVSFSDEHVGSAACEKQKQGVEFSGEGGPVFVLVGTTVKRTVEATDGSVYAVTVRYDESAGIPANAELAVRELGEGDEGYADYMARAIELLGADAAELSFVRAFDISLADPATGAEYQPDGRVRVGIRLLDVDMDRTDAISVVHFGDERAEAVDCAVRTETVEFRTDGFSVYVIVGHEGGEIITPRVEFHFLDEQFSEVSGEPGTYQAGPFYFPNKSAVNSDKDENGNYITDNDEYQNSQIVKSGETLEPIMNPPNLEIEEPDPNDPESTVVTKKYFFGWYMVEERSAGADGTVQYAWTADPEQLVFEQQVTIDPDKIVWADDDHTAITSLVWELNGVEHEVKAEDNSDTRVVLDEFGCAHVYLAPIYQDYYFVNFFAGAEGSDLGRSILTRRLVVLGSDGTAEIRIGDVQASSPDARHKIFTGWEGDLWQEDSQSVTRQTMTTLDDVGEEYNTYEDKDGFYITVGSHDLYPGKLSVDLYPIFTEVRWFKFVTGGAHNGATYVGDKHLYTTETPEEINAGTAAYYLTDMPVSARTGYRFKGWFADAAERDPNGDYIDGVQITDENGHIVSTAYTKYAGDGVTPLYEMKNGRLYVFKDVDAEQGVTLYAHWEEITDATIQVIVWRQKITDSKSAYDYQKSYDFEASYSIDTTSGLTLNDLLANGVLQAENRDLDPNNQSNPNRTDLSYTGFHFRTTEMSTPAVRGDGSTVVNVYYDRDLMTIYFYYDGSNGEPAYIYTETSNDNPEEQYGIVEGKYVPLTRKQGSGMKYNFRYAYQQTASDTILPQYALVSYAGGVKLYEELTREVNTVYNTRWMFETGNFWQRTTRYMDQGKTDNIFYLRGDFNWRRMDWNYYDSGYTLNDPPPYNDGVTYYCKYNNRYYELTPQTTTTTTYTWKLNGATYTGTRYRRLAGTEEYTGDLYTVSGYPGETFGADSRGGYVELDGTQISAYQWFTTTHVEGYFLDNDNTGTQQDVYGLVDGEYVKLTPSFGDTYTYKTANTYTASAEDDALWGLVNGEYVPLTRHESYSYNRTGYTYTYTTSNSGTQYGIVNGNIQQVYRNNGQWRITDEWNGTRYYGYRYTRSNSNNNAYTGTLFTVIPGTAANGESGFTQTDAETGNNLYGIEYETDYWGYLESFVAFQLRVTDNSYYTLADGTRYTGTRYAQGPGADWSGARYTRSGDAAPYTYTAHTENPSTGLKLYVVDGNNGHVALNWSVDVSGYTYEDVDGNVQPYTGDRYSFQTGEVETEYTGTRYTRARNNTFDSMITYTGLYGQTLAQNGYSWPSSIPGESGTWWWYDGYTSSWGTLNGSGTRTTFLEAFLFSDGGTVATFYGFKNSGSNHIYFYQEALDGSWTLAEDVTTSGGSNSRFYISDKYNGFYAYQYSTNGTTWNSAGNKVDGYYNGGSPVSYSGTLYIRFKRLSYSLIFEPNYPTAAGTTIAGTELTLDNLQELTDANRVTETVPFETPLSAYKDQPQPAQGPDNYIFEGWFEDDTCTKEFTFNEPMPAANMRLYAKWTPVKFRVRIDPNGGLIDHINYTAAAAGTYTYTEKGYTETVTLSLGDYGVNDGKTGYNRSQATFFNCVYNEAIEEYSNIERKFVPISDVAADMMDPTEVYYYVNTQYIAGYDLESDLRNAVYIIESELDDYYEFYRTWVQYKHDLTDGVGRPLSNEPLDFETWKETYLTKNASGGYQKYRRTTGTEEYELLGWYRLDADGNPEPMPYNFSDPVREPITLRAYWRLDAGYQIQYHADYEMDDGTVINGNLQYWTDPEVETARYSDEAATQVYRQPTGITANGTPTTEYIFRGWRLVNVSTNSQGQAVYTPIENGVFYDPGEAFTVRAAYADRASVIHMQAVYEEKDSSYRRPYITNLTLHANGGFITLDGESELTVNTDLSDTWDGVIGTVAATVATGSGDTELIEFGDIQSNETVRLYRYAADIDHVDGDDSKAALDPAGKNYFKHPDNSFLLGFDDEANEGDYVATYPADSVIGVQRNEDQTIYAVWEPLVYLKVVNATGVGDVTFGLSSSEGALQVVNARDGLFGRTPMTAAEMSSITVADGDYVWLAVPYGVVREIVDGEEVITKRHVTIEGTNNLGPGWLLTATSSLGGAPRSTLTGSLTGSNADYTSVKNQKPFGLSEQLELDPEGVVITFEAIQNPHTLVLDDNYPTTGVRTQEVYFDKHTNAATPPYGYDVVYGENQTLYYDLPTTSTRVGYVFLGWDPDPNWASTHDLETEKPTYTTGSDAGWQIANLTDFFKNETDPNELDSVKTLYAVWDTSAEAKIVYVYKEVPEPGDQGKEFTFTVKLEGTFEYQRRSSGSWSTQSGTFNAGSKRINLKHGEYIRIESSQIQAESNTQKPYIQAAIEKFSANGELLSTETLRYQWDYYNYPNTKQGSYYYRTFSFKPSFTVTEDDYSAAPHYYDTAMTCTALAEDAYPLLLDGTPAATNSLPLEDVEGRVLSWTKTEAGGRVIFTNTRQSADVTVTKTLEGGSSAAGVFNFTASYTLDGDTTQLGAFSVTSGTEGKTLEDIPVGAMLTVTETGSNLNDYVTTATVGGTAATVTETTATADGATVYNRSVRYTVAKGGTTVAYTNRLRSYPITFYKVDQDGNAGVPSYFRLNSATGLIAEQLYPAQTGTGEFFPGTSGKSNEFYVGTYTLTETFVGSNFLPLDGPITLTLSTADGGTLTSSNEDYVRIERVNAADPSQGFRVRVYNQKIVRIDIAKLLSDPILSGTRAFNFRVQYQYELLGKTVTYDNQGDLLSVRSGSSATISVPVNATLTVTEVLSATDAATYDTRIVRSYKDGEETRTDAAVNGTAYTYSGRVLAANDGDVLTFTNTRKTVQVTVTKTVDGKGYGNEGSFAFTAHLRNGSLPIADYAIFTNGTETTDDDLRTDGSGQITFSLSNGESIVLTVPAGGTLDVSEVIDERYETTITGASSTGTDGVSNTGTLAPTAAMTTVTFTNTRKTADITVKKTVANGITGDDDKAFTFTVQMMDGGTNLTNKLGLTGNQFRLKHGETRTLTVPLGAALTVTENLAAADQAIFNAAVQVDDKMTENVTIKTLSDIDAAHTVNFTNTRINADLTIVKTLVDPLTDTGSFAFTVTANTLSDPTRTVNVAVSGGTGSQTLQLPVGASVRLTEDLTAAQSPVYDATGDNGRTITVSADAAANVFHVTNTRKTVTVTVNKTVDGRGYGNGGSFDFTATVTNGSAPVSGWTPAAGLTTDANGAVSFSLSHQGHQDLIVPYGATVTVTETANDDYTTTVDGASGTGKTLTNLSAENTSVNFVNTRKLVTVNVYKTLVDPMHAQGWFLFAFQIDGGAEKEFPLKSGDASDEHAGYLIKDIPVGATLTITEKAIERNYSTSVEGSGITRITWTGSMTGPGDKTATFTVLEQTGSNVPSVTFTNTREIVTINVAKTVVDESGTTDQAFTFTATSKGETVHGDTSTDVTWSPSLSLHHGESGSFTVPTGTGLTIEEQGAENYEVSVSGTPTGTLTGSTYTIAAADVAAGTVTFTNTRKFAEVTVTKTLEDETDDNRFLFTATLTKGAAPVAGWTLADGMLTDANGQASFTLDCTAASAAIPASVTLRVPLGLNLSVAETGAKDTAGADVDMGLYTTAIASAAGSIDNSARTVAIRPVEAETLSVTFTNSPSGTPVIFTKVAGDTGNGLANAAFTLYSDAACTAVLRHRDRDMVAASDAAGTVDFGLVPRGTYYMKETAAPPGYGLRTEIFQVVVTAEGATIRVYDTETGAAVGEALTRIADDRDVARKVILKKVDPSYDALAGAEFVLLRPDGTELKTVKITDDANAYNHGPSGNNGAFYVGRLPLGTWYLKETVTPTGYQAPADGKCFRIVVSAAGVTDPVLVDFPETTP